MADVFETEVDARIAIALMPAPFTDAGIVFTVEATD